MDEDVGADDSDRMGKRVSSMVQFTSHETVPSDPMLSSSSTVSASTVISPVDVFIANVNRVGEELQPLVEWTYQFKATRSPEEVRNVIQICQVNNLQNFLGSVT
ncbi:unnamed protein product [Gongylonema pulchrum]|uniref:Autophagy-related protein 101 n=1 Tax=Gongylonema pulchrum TaxID=637853 RepID=A0A183DLM9_9BILA|nr:unnamed protein product [Gongylonema pulchrum]